MSKLKSLTFGALNAADRNPTLARRQLLVSRLEQQIALARDPLYLRTTQRWVIQDNGVKERVEEKRRVRPWWRDNDAGQVALSVRYGAKAMEFEKGKAAILLDSRDKLVPTLETLIAAVKAGELDSHLAQQSKERATAKRNAQPPTRAAKG